jgi:PAS domain S-box-containing protein
VLRNFDTAERIYPVPGGILNSLDRNIRKLYRNMSVDGIERCITILDSMKQGSFENYFIEMSSCSGSCIGGPCTNEIKGGYLAKREKIINYARKMSACTSTDAAKAVMQNTKCDFSKKFFDKSKLVEIPSEDVIQGILNSIGKFSKDKELNCGACGYKSCRDKAIAVYNGRAQVYMCLPYMRERAESISNIIINYTPYAIFALDKNLKIQELNKSAQTMFGLEQRNMEGAGILDLLPCDSFQKVLDTKEDIYDEKYYYEVFDITVKQSIINVPEHNTVVAIISDITEQEAMRQKIVDKQTRDAELAQKVIEKQMRVAQEIASLLGETTAETKVALTKLKKSIMLETGE